MSKKENFTLPSSKKRSTKAETHHLAQAPAFEILRESPEQINPAIILADELMRKDIAEGLAFDDLERAEKTLALSRREIERVEQQFIALVKTPSEPSLKIPVGF